MTSRHDLIIPRNCDFNQPFHFRQTSDAHAVKSIDYASRIIEVRGDVTTQLLAGDEIELSGNSEDASGRYTIESLTFGVNSTNILVAEDIDSSANANGTIVLDIPLNLEPYLSQEWKIYTAQDGDFIMNGALENTGDPTAGILVALLALEDNDPPSGNISQLSGYERAYYTLPFTLHGLSATNFVEGNIVLVDRGVVGETEPIVVMVKRAA